MKMKFASIFITVLIVAVSAFLAVTSQGTAQKQETNPLDPAPTQKKLEDFLKKEPTIVPVTPKKESIANHENTNRPTNPPTNPPGNQPGTQTPNINGLASEINSLNNQMIQQMNSCIALTRQAANQIGSMRAQERQLQEAINAANREIGSINTNTEEARRARFERQQRRDEMQFQRNRLNNTINNVRQEFFRSKSACQQRVYQINNAKRNLETQLSTAFSRSIQINF